MDSQLERHVSKVDLLMFRNEHPVLGRETSDQAMHISRLSDMDQPTQGQNSGHASSWRAHDPHLSHGLEHYPFITRVEQQTFLPGHLLQPLTGTSRQTHCRRSL